MDCRSCIILKHELMVEPDNHQLVDVGLNCLVCGFKGPSCYHGETKELVGISSECSRCHNYILYENDGKPMKEEIYLNDNPWVVRDFEDNECRFYIDNKGFEGIRLPMFEDSDIPSLIDKIELFVTFS